MSVRWLRPLIQKHGLATVLPIPTGNQMRIKKIGASPLTGTIFQGTLNTKTSMWVGDKTDVTEDCVAATAEHLRHIKKKYCWPTNDGKFLVLEAHVHDTLPDEFK